MSWNRAVGDVVSWFYGALEPQERDDGVYATVINTDRYQNKGTRNASSYAVDGMVGARLDGENGLGRIRLLDCTKLPGMNKVYESSSAVFQGKQSGGINSMMPVRCIGRSKGAVVKSLMSPIPTLNW